MKFLEQVLILIKFMEQVLIFIKFLEQVLIHVLMRILEQILNFMKIYVTGINIKRAGWSWSFLCYILTSLCKRAL